MKGTPTQRGTFTLTVTVTDAHGRTGTRSFSIAISLIGDFEKINKKSLTEDSARLFYTMENSTSVIFIRFLRVPPGRPNLFGDQ